MSFDPELGEKEEAIFVHDTHLRSARELIDAAQAHGRVILLTAGQPVAVIEPFSGTLEEFRAHAAATVHGIRDVTPPEPEMYRTVETGTQHSFGLAGSTE